MSAEIIKTPALINQERRESMADERFLAAARCGTPGAYRRVARRIRPLLDQSPLSGRMRHLVAVCDARGECKRGTAFAAGLAA
jgi:hypothetical protein